MDFIELRVSSVFQGTCESYEWKVKSIGKQCIKKLVVGWTKVAFTVYALTDKAI